MNYFTSGLYGNKELYFHIKNDLLRKNDRLWILGDLLDGNDERPWECLEILKDVIQSPNIHLVLGDHEYCHTMRILSMDNEEASDNWEKCLHEMDVSGSSLLNYMKNEVDEEELFGYADFMSRCEVSEMIKIGDSFFYLCHGAPTFHTNVPGGDMSWQYGIVTGEIDLREVYAPSIASDLRFREFEKRFGQIDLGRCFVVTGHTSVPTLISKYPGISTIDGIVYSKKKFCIWNGATADEPTDSKWVLLGIDAAGFFPQKV